MACPREGQTLCTATNIREGMKIALTVKGRTQSNTTSSTCTVESCDTSTCVIRSKCKFSKKY